MAGTPVTFNATSFSVPAVKDKLWGPPLRALLISLAGNALAKSGGNFTLTADANFGANFGLTSKYFKSVSPNISTTGVIRLANNEGIGFRNAANSGDLILKVNASNLLEFNGVGIVAESDLTALEARVTTAESDIDAAQLDIDTHETDHANPHVVTKTQVGLGNADNTSDATKDAATATLTNKTITTPTITNPSLTTGASFTEIATPAAPSAGILKVYPKSDDKLYTLNSAGVETQVGSGSSSGQVNYITNADFEATANGVLPANWSQYNDGSVAIPVDGTGGSAVSQVTFLASNSSPIRGTVSAVLTKDANNRQGVGYSFPFTLPAVDRSKPLNISTELTVGSGTYVNGDAAFYVIDVTNGTVITPSVAAIPGITNKWAIRFDGTTGSSYRLCIHIASTSTAAYTLKFDTMSVDTGVVVQSFAGGSPQTFTPVFAGVTVTNVHSTYTRFGKWAYVEVEVLASADATTTVTFDVTSLFSGATVDTGIWSGTTRQVSGHAWFAGGTNSYNLSPTYSGSGNTIAFRIDAAPDSLDATHPTADGGFDNTDRLSFGIWVPISIWEANINLGAGAQVEYASNSSATDANDTTSFITGPSGSTGVFGVTTLTTTRLKRVRFQNPIQQDDLLIVEVRLGSGPWVAVENAAFASGLNAFVYQNTVAYGLGFVTTLINSTDVDIAFGQYAYAAGTYGAAGTSWGNAAFIGYTWRVRKCKASSPVGFGMATATESGLYPAHNTLAGRYTPTLTNGTNVSASSVNSAMYSRVGNVVTVSGNITATTTAGSATASLISVSLPIASNLTAAFDLAGAGARDTSTAANQGQSGITISADTTNDRAFLSFNAVEAANRTMTFTFQYEVK